MKSSALRRGVNIMFKITIKIYAIVFLIMLFIVVVPSLITLGALFLAKQLDTKPDVATYERAEPPFAIQCYNPAPTLKITFTAYEVRCDEKAKTGEACWGNSWDTRSHDEKEDNAREHGDWYKYIQIRHWISSRDRGIVD